MAIIFLLHNIMTKQLNNFLFLLVFIIFIAFSLFVRVYGLDRSPISLNFDEASLGYNAFSLLKTGKDEYGISWPLNLRSFNDYKPAVYSYLTIPWIKIWGLSQTTTRLTSAICGTISLIFLFLVVKKITKVGSWLALFGIFIVSFYPWRLHYSRVAFETNVSTCFFLIAVYFLLNWSKNHLSKILFFLFSILSFCTYHSARLAIPAIACFYFIDPLNFQFVFNELKKWQFKKLFARIWPIIIIIFLILPLFFTNKSSEVLRRFNQTNVFSRYFPYTPSQLKITDNPFLNFKFHPFYYLGGIMSGHFLSYLSPRNISLNVFDWIDKSPQGISQSGMFGWLGGILFLIGLFVLIKQINLKNEFRFLTYWIFAGVFPSALTYEWLHPLRSLNAFPALEIISILGIFKIITILSQIPKFLSLILKIVLIGLLIFVIFFNLENEWNFGIWQTNGEFQPGGFKEGGPILNQLRTKYPVIYLDSPHAQSYAMFQFYMQYPPENIQKLASTRPPLGTEGFLNFNFDNFVFKKYNWIEDKYKSNFAYFTSSEVIESEINSVSSAKLIKIYDALGKWVASIITKD